MAVKSEGPIRKADFATAAGLLLSLLGVVGGLLLEGGRLQDIGQFTAAIIVIGGTLGAVLVSTPLLVLKGAMKRLWNVLFEKGDSPDELIEEVIRYAAKARKSGLVSLEDEALRIEDPFLRRALSHAVDGTDMQELRDMMELEIELRERRGAAEAKVFESAGGYAPTIGIIGAVMGLIQVMKNLANIEEVGHGIAVAFVATLYGVGAANLLLIPAAAKIRCRLQRETELRELMLEGVIGIIEGMNPKLIRSKLSAFSELTEAGPGRKAKAASGDRREAAAVAS